MTLTVNHEKVYMPLHKDELIQGLQKMGIYKVAGVPLARVSLKELKREYCRARAAGIRRTQHPTTPRPKQEPPLTLFSLSGS